MLKIKPIYIQNLSLSLARLGLIVMVMAGCVCPNRESDGPVCSAETTQTLCLLSGKDLTSLQFPPLKCTFPKHNGIKLTVQTDHKETV